jgi:hypothetical protein
VADEPEDMTLRMLRRIDQKIDRIQDDVNDLKTRITAVELGLAECNASIAGVNRMRRRN